MVQCWCHCVLRPRPLPFALDEPPPWDLPTSMLSASIVRRVLVTVAANASCSATCVVLARLVEPAVRSNLVIALGDLAFRFPNLLEPWTERIYGPLSDPDTSNPLPACLVPCCLMLTMPGFPVFCVHLCSQSWPDWLHSSYQAHVTVQVCKTCAGCC